MPEFKDKFHLTPEQSIFLAKKKWDENIYCGMKMENRAVTFPQTQTILNGVNVPDVQLDDIQAILNMRDAWKFLLGNVKAAITFDYWCKLNEYIARNEAPEWGKLRTGTVGISGTDYVPPIPEKEKTVKEKTVKEKTVKEMETILSITDASVTDKALAIFTWGTRGQFFWDGNKRTSLMLANKILVSCGAGIMTVTDKYMEQFNSLLLDYYITGNDVELKQFLYDNAIGGMSM